MKPRPEPLEPGEESVWDYPRPPRLERETERIRVVFNGETIAETCKAWRVLETSHPPVYYIPPEDLRQEFLEVSERKSFCEWKGRASYVTLRVGARAVEDVGWLYAEPAPDFEPIRDHVAFYAGPMDRCMVGDEEAKPQPGGFYGGWVTSKIVGPFKGEPGTDGW